jgi:hypothetical protein
MNRSLTLSAALFVATITGCSSTPTPQACAPTTGDMCTAATKPDATKAKAHLADHVKYPAKRADILAACADTPEFTAGEKQWISENLPEGDYKNADDAVRALRL